METTNKEMLIARIPCGVQPSIAFALSADVNGDLKLYVGVSADTRKFIEFIEFTEKFVEFSETKDVPHIDDECCGNERYFVMTVGRMSHGSLNRAFEIIQLIEKTLAMHINEFICMLQHETVLKNMRDLINMFRDDYTSGDMPENLRDLCDSMSILMPKISKALDEFAEHRNIRCFDTVIFDMSLMADKVSEIFNDYVGSKYFMLPTPFMYKIISEHREISINESKRDEISTMSQTVALNKKVFKEMIKSGKKNGYPNEIISLIKCSSEKYDIITSKQISDLKLMDIMNDIDKLVNVISDKYGDDPNIMPLMTEICLMNGIDAPCNNMPK